MVDYLIPVREERKKEIFRNFLNYTKSDSSFKMVTEMEGNQSDIKE